VEKGKKGKKGNEDWFKQTPESKKAYKERASEEKQLKAEYKKYIDEWNKKYKDLEPRYREKQFSFKEFKEDKKDYYDKKSLLGKLKHKMNPLNFRKPVERSPDYYKKFSGAPPKSKRAQRNWNKLDKRRMFEQQKRKSLFKKETMVDTFVAQESEDSADPNDDWRETRYKWMKRVDLDPHRDSDKYDKIEEELIKVAENWAAKNGEQLCDGLEIDNEVIDGLVKSATSRVMNADIKDRLCQCKECDGPEIAEEIEEDEIEDYNDPLRLH
jgi:hypothetical protein